MMNLLLLVSIQMLQIIPIIPMYLVSPQLFVTSEHIMSDSASTSSSGFSGVPLLRLSLSPLVVEGSGDVIVLRGVDPVPSFCEACDGEPGFDPGAADALCDSLLSASRFSSVPRSVRPLSSSASRPITINTLLAMRPRISSSRHTR